MNPNHPNLIKETNLHTLRNILHTEKTATKSHLADLSGLSVVTVQSLLQDLLQSGEISEDTPVQPKLGRPAASYRYEERSRLALIINRFEFQGKDTAAYTVYDLYGDILETQEEMLPKVTPESYCHGIEQMLERYPQICVIGFGLPGEEMNGRMIVNDYDLLTGTELTSHYQDLYKIPVFVENDINASILGYCERHAYSKDQDFCVIGIYLPSKYPGSAGICHNYELLKGRNHLAGELSCLPFDIDWKKFSYRREDLEDFTIRVIRVFMSIYNPDRIVIYDESGRSNAIREKLRSVCTSKIEQMMIPELKVKKSLKKDFQAGLIRLALQRILSFY